MDNNISWGDDDNQSNNQIQPQTQGDSGSDYPNIETTTRITKSEPPSTWGTKEDNLSSGSSSGSDE